MKVEILPSASRSEKDRIKLMKFRETESTERKFSQIVENAKVAMGLGTVGTAGSSVFSSDVLRVESTAPTNPNLTLVDLPGLFNAADKNQ